jgi:hypothetical protein
MYTFNVTSYRRTPKGAKVREEVINLHKEQIKLEGDQWVINLGYGYTSGFGNWCHEGADSAIPGRRYRIFRQWMPRKGDIIIDVKSGRKFNVGDVDGFIVYNAPLLESGKVVAVLKFEDYYKD